MYYAGPVQDLIDQLGRLPGVGPKSAQRIAFYLLKLPTEDAERLAQAVIEVKARISFCGRCFNIAEGDLCLVRGHAGGHAAGTDAVIAYGCDELATDRGRESHPVHEVVVREAVDVLGGQTRVGREEAVVLRLVRNLLVEADQALQGEAPPSV